MNSSPRRLSLRVPWKLSHVTHCLQCSLGLTKEPGFPAFWYIADWPSLALLPWPWLYLELSQGLTGACSCPTRTTLLSCRQVVIPQRKGELSFYCYTLHMILYTLTIQLQPWLLLMQFFWWSGLNWAHISECVIAALVWVSKKAISRRDLRDLVFLKACFLKYCAAHLSLKQTRNKGSLLNRSGMLHVARSLEHEIDIRPSKVLRRPAKTQLSNLG